VPDHCEQHTRVPRSDEPSKITPAIRRVRQTSWLDAPCNRSDRDGT
jgi:hypothetical protein